MDIATLQTLIGTVLPRIELRLKRVFDRKTGEHPKYGPWSLQSAFAELKNGEDIKVLFSKCQPVNDEYAGQMLTLVSKKGAKGLHGITVEENEYQGKKTLQLKLTDQCIILTEDDANGQPEGLETPSKPKPVASAHKAVEGLNTEVSMDVATSAKNRVNQYASLYGICIDTAMKRFTTLGDVKLPLEQVKDIATCLFIQSVGEFGKHMPVNKPSPAPVAKVEAPKQEEMDMTPDDIQF